MKAKTAEDRQLLELIEPVAESLGLDIVRVRLMGGTQRRRLQIMAERPSDHDIAVEECARLSRAVSEVFDAADPIAGEYLLEVSSPGVDRPLTRQSDFDLFEGFEARLETDRMIEGRKRFKGVIAGTDGDNVAMDLDGDVVIRRPLGHDLQPPPLGAAHQAHAHDVEAQAFRHGFDQLQQSAVFDGPGLQVTSLSGRHAGAPGVQTKQKRRAVRPPLQSAPSDAGLTM